TETIADLAARTAGAVVNLDTIEKNPNPMADLDPFFHDFFGGEKDQSMEEKGVGSGFVVEPDGLVLTNWHVVKIAKIVVVTLPDGRRFRASLVGCDPLTDLALIRIPARDLPALSIAGDDGLRVGDWVVAIGSPLGLSTTVTAGIVSALDRDLPINDRIPFIQTDAPINPGNSGGPLLDLSGRVVGVNTAVARDTTGIGFAIPAQTIREVLPQLEAKGHVDRAWLGVTLDEPRFTIAVAQEGGALVSAVAPGSPADRAGLVPGDRIVAIAGEPIRDPGDLVRKVDSYPVGRELMVTISRQGQRLDLAVQLGEMPAAPVDPGAEGTS
ncbi:MAG: trypsin-like peptidase domain-containing protein, partial [Cyanobacteria bacterium REEB65]|nr:trypsin-like peptidase domain-containing protein [Cyanobacteria bacterium REEB65]